LNRNARRPGRAELHAGWKQNLEKSKYEGSQNITEKPVQKAESSRLLTQNSEKKNFQIENTKKKKGKRKNRKCRSERRKRPERHQKRSRGAGGGKLRPFKPVGALRDEFPKLEMSRRGRTEELKKVGTRA